MAKIGAIIFVEGETEVEFYKQLLPKRLGISNRNLNNLKGNFNALNKIKNRTIAYLNEHSSVQLRVYCFMDRESRNEAPLLESGPLLSALKNEPRIGKRVVSAKVKGLIGQGPHSPATGRASFAFYRGRPQPASDIFIMARCQREIKV